MGAGRSDDLDERYRYAWRTLKIAYFRDGKSITVYRDRPYNFEKDTVITIQHPNITRIDSKRIETKQYLLRPANRHHGTCVPWVNYEWRICSEMVNDTKDLLCSGFAKDSDLLCVPTDIIELIAEFMSDVLEAMKHAQPG